MDHTTFSMEATAGHVDRVDKQLLKQINYYVRAHPFITQSLNGHTTTQRRTFERDVYDYARTTGLLTEQARLEVRRARAFCGELDYDSDDSRLGDEIDDSAIILTANPTFVSACKSGLSEGRLVEHVPMKVSRTEISKSIGKRDTKIKETRRLSESAVETQDPENNSDQRQFGATGTHEHNKIALDMISGMSRAVTRKRLKECRPTTISMAGSEAFDDQNTATDAVDTLFAPLQAPGTAKISKKRKAVHAKPVPSLSTSAALKGDRQQNSGKQSSTEVIAPNRVSDNLPDGQDEQLSAAKIWQIKDSHTKKSRKYNPKPALGDHAQPFPNDEATATQETPAKKEKRNKATKKAEAHQKDNPPKPKKPRRTKTTDLVSSIADRPLILNDEDGAVDAPATLTPSDKADDAAIESDRKASIKHEIDRKTKKECSKEQYPSKDTPANETAVVEPLETHVEASKLKKQNKKPRLHEQSETSARTSVEEPKKKSTKSKKRKKSSLNRQEKQEANGESKVETNASSKFASKFRKHLQADIALVVVPTEGEETEEDIRSEYFTPTKPKSKELLPDTEQDSGVKKQDTSPSKAKSNLRMGMEEKRRSFYAELRRRSSLGPTIAASLEGQVDTAGPVAELDVSAHIAGAEDEDLSKGESEKTKNIEQAVKPKKQNLKKRYPIGAEEGSGANENVRPENPATYEPAQVVEQDQEIPVVDSMTKPLAKVSRKKKNRMEGNSTAANTTGKALTGESNEDQSSTSPMGNAATSISLDQDIPNIPLQYSGWNPVNQTILNAQKVAESDVRQKAGIAVKSEVIAAHSYADDPMELDHESWTVTTGLEADPHPDLGKVSRKRKNTTRFEAQGKDGAGIIAPNKKSRLTKDELGNSADFSSPMIR
ncbi:hypothetical protein MMC27_001374 [Xylographa pallens]|nr:hypothetical protein [Xylographa pallens]